MTPAIELLSVSKSYREADTVHPVLVDASFSVGEGEIAVLVGRSGTGKSTLLNLVGGIDRPDGGVVRALGQDIGAADETTRTLFRRRHVGFVFQFFNLLPTLTVLENLLLPQELNGTTGQAARERALAMLEEVELRSRAQTYPDRLSGGEQQRVAIARALVHRPRLVLADEPTGNLDLETGRRVLDLLDRLTRKSGASMLMVTHGAEVVGLADRVLTLKDGRLAERTGE